MRNSDLLVNENKNSVPLIWIEKSEIILVGENGNCVRFWFVYLFYMVGVKKNNLFQLSLISEKGNNILVFC